MSFWRRGVDQLIGTTGANLGPTNTGAQEHRSTGGDPLVIHSRHSMIQNYPPLACSQRCARRRRVPPCSIVPDGPRKHQRHHRTIYINHYTSVEAMQVLSEDIRIRNRPGFVRLSRAAPLPHLPPTSPVTPPATNLTSSRLPLDNDGKAGSVAYYHPSDGPLSIAFRHVQHRPSNVGHCSGRAIRILPDY